MNRNPIWRVALALTLLSASLCSGCGVAVRHAPAAEYTLHLADPASGVVSVQVVFSRLAAGTVELGRYGSRDGQGDTAVVSGVRVRRGRSMNALAVVDEGEAGAQVWQASVGLTGRLTIAYEVAVAGAGSGLHSLMNAEQALLLTAGTLLAPTPWLGDLRALLQERVTVRVQAPEGWTVAAPWPLQEKTNVFMPGRMEQLVDAAIGLGRLRGYELRDSSLVFRAMIPRSLDVAQADAWVSQMAYQLQSVQQAFGRAPDLGETANLLLLLWVDPEPSAVAEARGLGDSVLVARAPADLPVALDQAVMREAYGLWNGAGVRAAVPRLAPDADPRAALLAGMNDYMAWRALLESGRIGRISYWDGVRALARGMGTQATGDIVAAASAVPSDASQPDPLRARGHLYGLLLDQRLRQDTGDSLPLAEAIRRLHEARNYYTTGQLTAWADWIEHLRQLTGLDYGPLYDGLVRFGDRAPLAEVPQLAGPLISETRTVTAPDGQPLVYQWLDGPSARAGIYLSDGPGGTPYDWLMIEGKALAPYLDMAYLDQRGAGRSALAPGAPLSLDALVDDIEVVRRDLGAERLVLVGHSWGGFLALWYAARYPERLDALVLVAPITSYQQIAETIGGQTTQRAVDPRLSAVADGVDSYEEWTASLAAAKELGLYGSDLRAAQAASEQAYQRLVAGALLPPWVALENPQLLPVLVGRDDLLHADPLQAIAAGGERSYDVLWICGRRDGLVPAESLERAQRLVGGQVVTLAESGHEVFIDTPAAVLNVLITFLLQQ